MGRVDRECCNPKIDSHRDNSLTMETCTSLYTLHQYEEQGIAASKR